MNDLCISFSKVVIGWNCRFQISVYVQSVFAFSISDFIRPGGEEILLFCHDY